MHRTKHSACPGRARCVPASNQATREATQLTRERNPLPLAHHHLAPLRGSPSGESAALQHGRRNAAHDRGMSCWSIALRSTVLGLVDQDGPAGGTGEFSVDLSKAAANGVSGRAMRARSLPQPLPVGRQILRKAVSDALTIRAGNRRALPALEGMLLASTIQPHKPTTPKSLKNIATTAGTGRASSATAWEL